MVNQDSKITIDRATVEQALDVLDRYEAESLIADALRKELQQPEQEPVAWLYTSRLAGNQQYITRFQQDLTTYKADKVWPLYTTPPAAQPEQRKPLTDEQIAELMMDTWGRASIGPRHAPAFARAIESAHGIKEPKP